MSTVAKTEDIADNDEVLVMNFWEDGEEFPAPTQIKLEEYSGNNSPNLDQIYEAFHHENGIKLEDCSVSVDDINQNILVNNALVPPIPEEEFILEADATADILAVARRNEVENDDSEMFHNRPDLDVITSDSDSGTPNNTGHVVIQNHLSDNGNNDKTVDANVLHEENSATDKVNNILSIIITNVESVVERSENISTYRSKKTVVGENLKISGLNSVIENEESQGNLACKNQGEVKHVFKCEICPFTAKTRFSMSRHVLLHTNTDTQITKSAAISAKSNHAKNSGSGQNICCEYCSHKSTSLGNLKMHLLLHTKYNMPIYSCKACDYKSTKHSLTRHMNRAHKSNKIKYTTNANTKIKKQLETTSGNETLELPSENSSQPKNSEKPKSNTFKCKFCPFTSKIRFALNRHILIHTNIRKKSEGSSDNKSQPKSHISGGSKCKYCSFKAKNKVGLVNHVRLLHKITNMKLKRTASKVINVVREKSQRINSVSSKEVVNTNKTDSTNVNDSENAFQFVPCRNEPSKLLKNKKNHSDNTAKSETYSRNLKLPLLLHNKFDKPFYSCNQCSFHSSYEQDFTRHMKRVHESNILKYADKNVCGRQEQTSTRSESGGLSSKSLSITKDVCFNNIEELTTLEGNNPELLDRMTHVSLDSSSILYGCEICDFGTNSKETLILHKATHSTLNLTNDKNKIQSEKSEKTEQFTKDVKPKRETTNISLSKNTKLTNNEPKRNCILLKNNQRRCNACKRDFLSRRSFSLHKCHNRYEFNKLVKCDSESRYICKVCEFSTFKISVIQNHLVVHKSFEEAAIHKCSVCSFRSKYKSSLVNHMSKIHANSEKKSKNFKYNCDICGFKTNYYGSIRYHKIRCHSELLTCDICGYKTYFSLVMVKHMKYIHKLEKNKDNKTDETSNEIKYKCNDCDFQTKYKHNLQNHKIVHININEVRVYKNRTYNIQIKKDNSQELSNGAKTSNSDIDKQETRKSKCTSTKLIKMYKNTPKTKLHSCNFCSFSSNSKASLYNHVRIHRSKQKGQIFKCDICTYSTLVPHYLPLHKKRHETSKIYNCGNCNYSSFVRSNLSRHRWTANHYKKSNSVLPASTSDTSQVPPESTKPPILFSCQHCEYTTNIRFKLKKHIEKTHSKRSKCTSTNLKKRCKNTHKTKLFSCDFCSFSTNSKGSLYRHHRVHWGKQKGQILKCDICTYSTLVPHYLHLHKKIHDTSKIYSCGNCNYSSFVRANLSRHRWSASHYEKSNSVLVTSTSDTSQVLPESTKPPIVFSCQHCEYKTNIRFKLERHIEKTHPKHKTLKPFQIKSRSEMPILKCDFCPYGSKFKFNLKKHLRKCPYKKVKKVPELLTISKTPILKCSSCFYTTKYRHALDNHFNTCHIEK